MLTPRFKIEQTDNTILISIVAPYVNFKKAEIHILDNDFRFFSNPYYLRLTLPGNVCEGDNSSATYKPEIHSFVIQVDKVVPGEYFPNLEMLTSMLTPKNIEDQNSSKPIIEVLSSTGNEQALDNIKFDPNDFSYVFPIEEDIPSEQLLNQHKFGFAQKHNGLGSQFEVILGEITQILNPGNYSENERRKLQEEKELNNFSESHYFADLMMHDLSSILSYRVQFNTFQSFNDADREQLKNLKNQEFLLDKNQFLQLFLGVIDILFAYMYDLRINEGKHCIESQWNISRISSTFSFFRVFDSMDSVVRSCIRSCLIYPLYRHYKLSLLVLKDVSEILSLGNVAIVKCFINIHKLFSSREPYYLLNQIYMDEYCVWVQQQDSHNWKSLSSAFKNSFSKVKKEDIGLDLEILDAAAKATYDEAMEEEVAEQISELSLKGQIN